MNHFIINEETFYKFLKLDKSIHSILIFNNEGNLLIDTVNIDCIGKTQRNLQKNLLNKEYKLDTTTKFLFFINGLLPLFANENVHSLLDTKYEYYVFLSWATYGGWKLNKQNYFETYSILKEIEHKAKIKIISVNKDLVKGIEYTKLIKK